MTSYGFPHHGNRSFAIASDDALPWVLLYRQARKWLESRLCRLFNVILNGRKNALWEKQKTGQWHRVKNLLPWMTSYGFPHHGNRSFAIASGWRLNVLYKDHGAGRQKELLAHAVRLMIPACRNDLIVKEYLACSRQLTADSFYLLTVFLTTAANPSPLISKAMSKQRLLFSVFCLWPTADGYQLTAIGHHSLSERLGLFIKIVAKGIQFLYISMYNKVQT